MKELPPPPFDLPLSDPDLLLMGKIAILWGQIDESFNSCLRLVLKIDNRVFESLLGNQMIGSRVSHMKAAIHTATDSRNRELLSEIVSKMEDVLPSRNAAMHGCWGRYVLDPSYKKFRVGTFNHQKPKSRFF
ncbi:hypothetical protein AAFN47_01965 [Hoeflea sp. CAU 1731]